MTQPLDRVRAHLDTHFDHAEPAVASVTFLGAESIDVLRYRADADGRAAVAHYVSLGFSRHPMVDPTAVLADPELCPRAEVVLQLRDTKSITGLARSLAIVAASPAVEGVVLMPDALVDQVIEAIIKSARTGKVGDGKIFVFDLVQVVRIRTGERDASAI